MYRDLYWHDNKAHLPCAGDTQRALCQTNQRPQGIDSYEFAEFAGLAPSSLSHLGNRRNQAPRPRDDDRLRSSRRTSKKGLKHVMLNLNQESPKSVVMVVDDEDSVRKLACRALELAGFRVIEARDGVEALGHTKAGQLQSSARQLPNTDFIVEDRKS